jgi:TetR/AcrR family transcriptional repressor of nem operon
MGRKLEFCRTQALHTAMENFWAKGYEHTSMRDLAASLGLHLGSVYNALGDKEKVFESALRLHLDEYVMPEMKRMVESDDPIGALNRIFQMVIEECGAESGAPGCFLINSLLDINGINERITDILREYMERLEQSYMTCIQKAQALGQVPMQHDAKAYAHFILSTIFSLRTMAKLNMPQEHLRDVHACAIKALTTA